MGSALQKLLAKYRASAVTEREKGTYFEELTIAFLENDPTQASQYDKVWTYADWAKEQGLSGKDTGIDLVARIAEDGTFCAIQCKFYGEDKTIQKGDINSFFAASSKTHFARRLVIDSTKNDWGSSAQEMMDDQSIETLRISLEDLEKSPIEWTLYAKDKTIKLAPKKELREHQKAALDDVKTGLAEADRGKLIMACGTGKTFTSLKIAEELAGAGKRVLYLVPSLALMSQTVREWSIDTTTPLRAFASCSDAQVGKRKSSDDIASVNVHDLAYPATTNSKKLAERVEAHHDDERMTVVFSTYQSISVISDAQKKHGLEDFDLIICDEAHRTTGATLAGEDDSNFVKVHDQKHIRGNKRLYMTATPRIYGDAVKSKANEVAAELASMDDESKFGKTLHTINFSEAVQRDLLTDYKVIVLAVDEGVVSAGVQKRLTDESSELKLDDATKIVGCYRALSKYDLKEDLIADSAPMRRAVAFCKDIKSSKLVKQEFASVVEDYLTEQGADDEMLLHCEVDHVDGTFNAKSRHTLLEWLSDNEDPETCRILSNARCLSEGVDVPTLDAILFLHPRKSQVDVVQSVGRVMRLAEGKKMGYVILPVGVPAGMEPDQALNDNEKYKVVWQILNALRAHDDRFDATINKAGLGVDVSDQIEIVAVANKLPVKAQEEKTGLGLGKGSAPGDDDYVSEPAPKGPEQHTLFLDEFSKAIMAKIVKKCGTRDYWADWATDIAKIAQTHITRITATLSKPGPERDAFDGFLEEIRDDLNDTITEADAIEMLAQHIITKPVFDALFEGYSFADNNPVSKAMQTVLAALDEHNLAKEAKSLEKFYASVRMKAEGIESAEAKQKIIVELYDKFFRNAFPRMTERLGIVYTPVEVVDFIIHSVNDVLKQEFGQTLGSKGVHILDPFTGTGTFITRLLQSGLITEEELEHKYKNEIHANEIVLLAYYIAAINIEAVYHTQSGGDYEPFNGICLTDTFQLYEKDDMISALLEDNTQRRNRQKALDIRVIMGNPPYSAGQRSANDNAANVTYPNLDESIRKTYAEHSTAILQKNLYDSYIRAIRWGSDRIGESGVMAYVSGSAWIERNFADGMRKCLADEFTNLYVFHLRGDIRKNMLSKGRAKEGGNIFGSGSMTGIAITLFVKNPDAPGHGNIYFHDIGDDLSGSDKLAVVQNFKSIAGISKRDGWARIVPDKYNDWLNQRDDSFEQHIKIGDKKDKRAALLFSNYSSGVKTNRDAWCCNFSQNMLSKNMTETIDFYNSEVDRYQLAATSSTIGPAKQFIDMDPTKISWDRTEIAGVERGKKISFDKDSIALSSYRPFTTQWFYFNRSFNNCVYQIPQLFPIGETNNLAIAISGVGARSGFSCLMVNALPGYDLIEKGQCFPRYLYEKQEAREHDLYAAQETDGGHQKRDAITDAGLTRFQAAYPGEQITKDDLFYYVYGLLHSEDYRTRFADNLSKQLPRIPAVKTFEDFKSFVDAGRNLAELHVNYETVEPYPVVFKEGALELSNLTDDDYRVTQMKFGKDGKEKDRSVVIYNSKITMTNIPLEAYDYIVNGKPALEWVMERQCIKTDKKSGIVNDANDYAIETVGNPAYPLELFQRVITVSLETMKIVRALPKLEFEAKGDGA